ncbi:hypothetical protein BDV12DRAFT_203634 [Aspergillus spectabilis]
MDHLRLISSGFSNLISITSAITITITVAHPNLVYQASQVGIQGRPEFANSSPTPEHLERDRRNRAPADLGQVGPQSTGNNLSGYTRFRLSIGKVSQSAAQQEPDYASTPWLVAGAESRRKWNLTLRLPSPPAVQLHTVTRSSSVGHRRAVGPRCPGSDAFAQSDYHFLT